MIFPAVTINLNNIGAIPIRNFTGDSNPFGGQGGFTSTQDIVTLPGEPYSGTTIGVASVGYPNQFIPVLASTGTGSLGTGGNAATNQYVPITGVRDAQGNILGQKIRTLPLLGFGSCPYPDAEKCVRVHHPEPAPCRSGRRGQQHDRHQHLRRQHDRRHQPAAPVYPDRLQRATTPSTITASSVILEASDNQGNFGTVNSRTINLAGLLSFNPTTDILTINTSGIFNSTATANDEYRIILKGTAAAVIRNTDGLALDGFNILNGNLGPCCPVLTISLGATSRRLLVLDTHPPAIVAGNFQARPGQRFERRPLHHQHQQAGRSTGRSPTSSRPPTPSSAIPSSLTSRPRATPTTST